MAGKKYRVKMTDRVCCEDWDLTKIFTSPKGAITRLHYDNGGAHVGTQDQGEVKTAADFCWAGYGWVFAHALPFV